MTKEVGVVLPLCRNADSDPQSRIVLMIFRVGARNDTHFKTPSRALTRNLILHYELPHRSAERLGFYLSFEGCLTKEDGGGLTSALLRTSDPQFMVFPNEIPCQTQDDRMTIGDSVPEVNDCAFYSLLGGG